MVTVLAACFLISPTVALRFVSSVPLPQIVSALPLSPSAILVPMLALAAVEQHAMSFLSQKLANPMEAVWNAQMIITVLLAYSLRNLNARQATISV